MPDHITARVEPPSRPPLCLWHEPADSSILDAIIRQHGRMGLYARHTQPAIKAAKALGYEVPELWERFPGSKFGRTGAASLRDFLDWPGSGTYDEWRAMVKRATTPSANGKQPVKYVAYMRAPSDLNGDAEAFREVLRRVKDAGAVCCFEYAADAFSTWAYDLARDEGLLHAIEPVIPELRFPSTPRIITQAHLESDDLAQWPANWPGWRKGHGPPWYVLAPDEPFAPQWPRAMAAWGFRPVVYTHRLIGAKP